MSIHLHINKKDITTAKKPELHSIPCKIYADDTAKVNTYFKPYIKNIDDKFMQSSFRGYPLQGKKIVIPEGYTGITFYEYKKPDVEGADRNIYATSTFKEFTYWNYDKLPSQNDALVSALDWIEISEALHSTDEETVST